MTLEDEFVDKEGEVKNFHVFSQDGYYDLTLSLQGCNIYTQHALPVTAESTEHVTLMGRGLLGSYVRIAENALGDGYNVGVAENAKKAFKGHFSLWLNFPKQ